MHSVEYDPFAPGPFRVGVRTIQAHDLARGRLFPCEIWHPANPDVPTLYLAAELDTMIPLASAFELFDRTPASKRLFILRRADHQTLAP